MPLRRLALLATLVAHAIPVMVMADVIADPPIIALGYIEPRSTITRNFRLVNTGSAPVTIASAVPSCTCTTVEAQGKTIPAGGVLELPMTMKVAASTGLKVAGITFTFREGVPPVKVDMQGEIAFPVRATTIDFVSGARVPFVNAFGDPANQQGAANAPQRGTVIVESIDGAPFRILSVMGRPPEFLGESDPSTPRALYEVRYDLQGLACESFPPYLVISTDHPKAPLVDLRIRHKCSRISPRIPFAEYRANLGAVVPGLPALFDFELKQANGWRATGVASSDPRVKLELVGQRVDGTHTLISMRATPDASLRGTMLFPATLTATDPSGATQQSDFWICLDAREGSQKAGS